MIQADNPFLAKLQERQDEERANAIKAAKMEAEGLRRVVVCLVNMLLAKREPEMLQGAVVLPAAEVGAVPTHFSLDLLAAKRRKADDPEAKEEEMLLVLVKSKATNGKVVITTQRPGLVVP